MKNQQNILENYYREDDKNINKIDNSITIEEHLTLLRNSGFRVVEILWRSYLQAGFYCIK